MPSLRRTVSSPAVRSSPYPTSSSAANVSSGPMTRPGYGHRRSSGSEIATRRVLADIEWWRVADGQRDLDAEQDSEDNRHGDHEQTPNRPTEDVVAGIGLSVPSEGPISPAWPGFSENLSLFPELLVVVPQTPPRRGHRLESSTSSLESTPEASEGPVEGLRLGMQDLGFSDATPPPAHFGEKATSASSSLRSRSFVNPSAAPRRDIHDDYADFAISPLSSHSPVICN